MTKERMDFIMSAMGECDITRKEAQEIEAKAKALNDLIEEFSEFDNSYSLYAYIGNEDFDPDINGEFLIIGNRHVDTYYKIID